MGEAVVQCHGILLTPCQAEETDEKHIYCNRDGLFAMDVVKGIDDKQVAYEDVEERRALERMAERLFG